MQAYAIFAVNEHLEFLLAEAAQHRESRRPRPSVRARISNALAAVADALDEATRVAPTRVPAVTPYPYPR